jgi:hypothetical protein
MDLQINPIILTDPFILEFFSKQNLDQDRFIAYLIRNFENGETKVPDLVVDHKKTIFEIFFEFFQM